MSSINDSLAGGSSRRSWLKKLGAVLSGGVLLGKSQAATASSLNVAAPQGLDSFLSEIMLVSFNFAPKGWALCDGQVLPINQNQALFSLLGARFGGDGRVTFALPDLRGRVVAHSGNGLLMADKGGEAAHVLLANELPPHVHGFKASTALGTTNLSGTSGPTVHNYLADNGGGAPQYGGNVNTQLANSSTATPPVNVSSAVGGGLAHNNMQPYITLNYIICLQGIYPSAN